MAKSGPFGRWGGGGERNDASHPRTLGYGPATVDHKIERLIGDGQSVDVPPNNLNIIR